MITRKTEQVIDAGDGVEIRVPEALDRMRAATRLTQAAAEILAELDGEPFVAPSRTCRAVAPTDPVDVGCPREDCEGEADYACTDTRPGRDRKAMVSFPPERSEVFRALRAKG